MIVTIKKKNPHRYACKRCKCEVGNGPNPETALCVVDSAVNGQYIRTDDGEQPIAFNRDCECKCHDVWRMVFGQPTERTLKMRATWNARTREPVKPLPRDDEPPEDDLW